MKYKMRPISSLSLMAECKRVEMLCLKVASTVSLITSMAQAMADPSVHKSIAFLNWAWRLLKYFYRRDRERLERTSRDTPCKRNKVAMTKAAGLSTNML